MSDCKGVCDHYLKYSKFIMNNYFQDLDDLPPPCRIVSTFWKILSSLMALLLLTADVYADNYRANRNDSIGKLTVRQSCPCTFNGNSYVFDNNNIHKDIIVDFVIWSINPNEGFGLFSFSVKLYSDNVKRYLATYRQSIITFGFFYSVCIIECANNVNFIGRQKTAGFSTTYNKRH